MKIVLIMILVAFSSCSVTNNSKPKTRDIKKAMKHSTWEYKMPDINK